MLTPLSVRRALCDVERECGVETANTLRAVIESLCYIVLDCDRNCGYHVGARQFSAATVRALDDGASGILLSQALSLGSDVTTTASVGRV